MTTKIQFLALVDPGKEVLVQVFGIVPNGESELISEKVLQNGTTHDAPVEDGFYLVVSERSSTESANLLSEETRKLFGDRCLACGGHHPGRENLPCPKMVAT